VEQGKGGKAATVKEGRLPGLRGVGRYGIVAGLRGSGTKYSEEGRASANPRSVPAARHSCRGTTVRVDNRVVVRKRWFSNPKTRTRSYGVGPCVARA